MTGRVTFIDASVEPRAPQPERERIGRPSDNDIATDSVTLAIQN